MLRIKMKMKIKGNRKIDTMWCKRGNLEEVTENQCRSLTKQKTPGPTPQGFPYLLYPICDLLAATRGAAQGDQTTQTES